MDRTLKRAKRSNRRRRERNGGALGIGSRRTAFTAATASTTGRST